jgi:hypothetical protein
MIDELDAVVVQIRLLDKRPSQDPGTEIVGR